MTSLFGRWPQPPLWRSVFCGCLILTTLAGCGSMSCFTGSEIAIPASDSTSPTVTLEVRMPDGSVVNLAPPAVPNSKVIVPVNGDVSLTAVASDPQGVRDVRLFVNPGRDVINNATGIGTRTGPGLLSGPTKSNRDNASVGQAGCTARVAVQTVPVEHVANSLGSRTLFYEVWVEGENFGGQSVRIPMFELRR